jgi:unsaturated chondroitin disaccharide hydrolase
MGNCYRRFIYPFRFKKKWFWRLAILSIAIALILAKNYSAPSIDKRSGLSLEQRIEISFELAQDKLVKTIYYLQQNSGDRKRYPTYTQNQPWQNSIANSLRKRRKLPNGVWGLGKEKFWAAGAFPGLLWKMQAIETDPAMKKFWVNHAKLWGEPLRQIQNPEDMTINNLFVFQPWFENASGQEKAQQLQKILQGATELAKPYRLGNQGRFHEDIGTMGFERKATRTDKKIHWHSFIDHTINVEHLLWAAEHNPNPTEAERWQHIAIRHIKTISKTFGTQRRPGKAGTWQRGYFDHQPNSPTYGQFLFNEGKQGWGDKTTWSRGQAWVIYAACVTYKYTKDPEILAIAKDAIDYFLANLPDRFPGKLRREGDFIPPWDFDYALQKNPDTQRDSSAAAIAISGMLKLIGVLPATAPDRQRYLKDVENILLDLTSSEYLPDGDGLEMSLLRHGCYHHFDSITPSSDYDNGLIWGDYFFVDALSEYQKVLGSR